MSQLSIANLKFVYSTSNLDTLLQEAEDNVLLRKTYTQMKLIGGERFVIKPTKVDVLDEVLELCPNFQEIIQDLKKYLSLALSGVGSLSFAPILLLGDPGVGKTHFSKCVAKALHVDSEFVSMNSLTAGWILSGSAPTWQGARPGIVAKTLIEKDAANPLIILDEIDKSAGDSRYDPMGALYQLLEKETASHYRDEFIGNVDFDTSDIFWVATANDASKIPEPIMSRLMVYEVPSPTKEQTRHIAQRVYAQIIKEHAWEFVNNLSDDVLDLLEAATPRTMKKLLLNALGTANLNKRDYLQPTDFGNNGFSRNNRMGFV